MSGDAASHEAQIWAPPTPSAGRKKFRWQKITSIGAVAALHLVLLAMCAVRPLVIGSDGQSADAKTVVYVTSDLTLPEPGHESRPARLIESSAPKTEDFARRAGVAPGKSVRVMLAVKVSGLGVASDIRVAASSGSSRADALAIEYARALRWRPAAGQVPDSYEEIRLPVVLAMPGGRAGTG